MSPLQIGLLVLGGLVIVGVWLYNRWTTRRYQPKRSAQPAVRESEGLAPSVASARGEPGDLQDRVDPVLPTSADAVPDAVADPVLTPRSALDASLDALVTLVLDQDLVSGDAVLAALPGTRRVGSKSFLVEGCNAQSQGWEPPRAGQRYTTLRAGLQLASRAGPLNEIEFSEFVVKIQAFADAVGASPEFPDMMDEVARARDLDQFASSHDAQLAFTVRALRASWSPGYVSQHAASCGFVPGALPGRMVLPSETAGAPPVLVLQYETQLALADDPEQVALREFHLLLDVPHVAREERPFVRMREVSQQLAQRMEGAVTDGGARALGQDDLDQIGADLEALYDALSARNLPAGSALTRRLFS